MSDSVNFIFRATKIAVCCAIRKKYQCYICSSHSYNYDLTLGPLGPRQIINSQLTG